LPSQRLLAAELRVSRNTILRAYRELEREGWARSRVGRGTFASRPIIVPGSTPTWAPRFSAAVQRLTTPFLGEGHAASPVPLDLARGKVAADPSIIEPFRQILDLVLEREGSRAFDPGPPAGLAVLRAAIAAHLGSSGARVRPQEVLITAGARQAIHLLASIFLDPGDAVILEAPSYRGAIQTFQSVGARLICIPTDDRGLDVEALEGVMAHTKPKLIYTVPTFQNPSGITMTLQRRQALLDVAAHHGVLIVEDDPYWELRYEGSQVPRIKSLDAGDLVIHIGTFSKLIFPGVRVGWMAGPARVLEQATVAKAAQGMHVSSLSQWTMARLLEEGLLESHLRRASLRLRTKRDVFLAALSRHSRGRLTFRRPEGGYYVWCRLPPPLQAADFLKVAIARGVSFVPGPAFWPSGGDPYALRLCFAAVHEPGLEEAARRLGQCMGEAEAGYAPLSDDAGVDGDAQCARMSGKLHGVTRS
jgi:DNA-binding transcriptional MocR family regulator